MRYILKGPNGDHTVEKIKLAGKNKKGDNVFILTTAYGEVPVVIKEKVKTISYMPQIVNEDECRYCRNYRNPTAIMGHACRPKSEPHFKFTKEQFENLDLLNMIKQN